MMFPTVTIPQARYERLVRDAQTLENLKAYITHCKYPAVADIRIIAGVENTNKESEEKTNGSC